MMALTSNHPGIKPSGFDTLTGQKFSPPSVSPFLINGRPLKSINQFFYKRVAKAQSIQAWK